ncbi:MAG: DUF6544 family protein [Candidatus Nanopelagicales bacterium]|nr:hypothetical protein [Candidatus Nanopelagicales bacterium]MDZ4250244.1 DUF6544 family protein [Candidatus Nanopelagicales bacterium]
MPDARLLAGAAALFGLGAAGFGMPAPLPTRSQSIETLEYDPPDPAWPDLLHKWINTAFRGLVPRASTAEFVGSGRLRLGRSPWLPVQFRTAHVLGEEFVAELSATWFGRPVLRAMDAYVIGRGISQVRGNVTTGPGLDIAAVPYLWSEAMLVPAVWGRPEVRWTQTADDSLTLEVAPGGRAAAPLIASVTADPDTGLPSSFSVEWRPKDPEGTEGAGWQVSYSQWRDTPMGWAPGLEEVTWADEGSPWLRIRPEAPSLQVDIAERLGSARGLLRSGPEPSERGAEERIS